MSSGPTKAPSALVTTLAPTVGESGLEQFVDSSSVWIIAFICSTIAILISGVNIFRHLVYYNEPALQKNIVRILFMVPFYALFSFLSLAFSSGQTLLDTIRDVYEAFVVYSFLNLMLSYCGGENACLSVIMYNPGSISHVLPFNLCLPDMSLNSRFLRLCKQGTIQFVIVKPLMAAINLIVIANGKQDAEAWVIFESVVYNISYTLALYMLVLFYKATHEHPGLKNQRPILKFLSVKLVVFATYYQGVLVAVLPGQTEAKETFNSFLLCCEMVIFAALQYCAFSWKEFADPSLKDSRIASRSDSAFDSIGDIQVPDRSPGASSSSPAGAAAAAGANAKDVISMHDVANDAYYNFNNKYGNHVLLDSAGASVEVHVEDDYDDEFDSKVRRTQKHALSEEGANPFSVPTGQRDRSPNRRMDTGVGETFDATYTSSSPVSPESAFELDPAPTFDPSLPSYDADKDVMGVSENPFAADIADPLGISRRDSDQASVTSIDFSNQYSDLAIDGEQGGWTADFADGASKTKKKKKSKKEKNKAQSPNSGTSQVDLV